MTKLNKQQWKITVELVFIVVVFLNLLENSLSVDSERWFGDISSQIDLYMIYFELFFFASTVDFHVFNRAQERHFSAAIQDRCDV